MKPVVLAWSKLAATWAGPNRAALEHRIRADIALLIRNAPGWFIHVLTAEGVTLHCTGHESMQDWAVLIRLGPSANGTATPSPLPDPDNDRFVRV